MKSVTEHIRSRILSRICISDFNSIEKTPIEILD